MKHLYESKKEFNVDVTELTLPSFDCRIITTAKHLKDYFIWRQNEAWRNCLNGYAQKILRTQHSPAKAANILYKMNKSQVHEMLFQHGINVAHTPTWQRRGLAVYKKQHQITGYNPKLDITTKSYRKKVYVDLELDLFTKNFPKNII